MKFRVSARVRTGPVADTTYVAYTDAAGTVLADISATEGGSALAGSSFTLDEFGKAIIWGPTDGTSNLFLRTPDDASLGVQEITADADSRLDTIEAASGIPASTVDVKGDLIAGTANNVVSRLAAGANDTVLTADSSTGTGLKWAAPATVVTDHGALSGLADDDHPQYETSAEAAAKITTHEAAGDPHPTYETSAEAAAKVTTHEAAADPHAGYLKEADIAAKGDLYVGTANDTVGILTVGTAGLVPVADSTATPGLRYAGALSLPSAKNQGLTGWSMDPAYAFSTSNLTWSAGVVLLQKLWAVASETVGNLYIGIAANAATPANSYAALYATDGTRLAVTAELGALYSTSGARQAPLVSAVPVVAGTAYYIGVLVGSAGTMPQMNRGASNAVVSVGLAAGAYRTMLYGTGQTTMPDPITMGSASLTGSIGWVGMGP